MTACPGTAAPKLDRVRPLGLIPGQTNQITFSGEGLADVTGVWTSFGVALSVVRESAAETRAVFSIHLPSDFPPGIGLLRLFGPDGVSNPLLVMVDDVPRVEGGAGAADWEGAPLWAIPGAGDGVMPDLSRQYYRVEVSAGQRVSFEVAAERLGSSLDPVVRLLDARQGELLRLDDSPGLGADVRFQHVFEEGGSYWLELSDVSFRGGSRSFYHLRAGDFPLASLPYPMALSPGEEGSVVVLGEQVEGVEPRPVRIPPQARGIPMSVRYPQGRTSAFVFLEARSFPRFMETEPNDVAPAAAAVGQVPSDLYGRFEKAGDKDYWELHAKQGSFLRFQARTRSVNSSCDVWMQLLQADGSEVATAKINEGEDGILEVKIPAEGKYYLLVEELNGGGGPDLTYRIECGDVHPAFELSLETDRINVAEGGELKIKVTAERWNYDGPISLALAGLEGDLDLREAVIPEKKKETTLKRTLPHTARAGTVHVLRVMGTATIGERERSATAHCRPSLLKMFSGLDRFPGGVDTMVVLGVAAP